jgi:hypothetical protein
MTSTHAEELARACQRDGVASVLAVLLHDASTGPATPEARVWDVLDLLEAMSETHADAAICLMIALWPVASELTLHGVCDAIDIWISNHRSDAVVQALKHAAASTHDPAIKRHLESLLV